MKYGSFNTFLFFSCIILLGIVSNIQAMPSHAYENYEGEEDEVSHPLSSPYVEPGSLSEQAEQECIAVSPVPEECTPTWAPGAASVEEKADHETALAKSDYASSLFSPIHLLLVGLLGLYIDEKVRPHGSVVHWLERTWMSMKEKVKNHFPLMLQRRGKSVLPHTSFRSFLTALAGALGYALITQKSQKQARGGVVLPYLLLAGVNPYIAVPFLGYYGLQHREI